MGTVGGYSVPATVIASDSELGVVIRVFEKVNSTGKKLTLFDLINAKSFQTKEKKYSGGLSDYLNSKILKATSENQSLSVGVNNFLKYDEDNRIFEKLDRIVRTFEIAELLKNRRPRAYFSLQCSLRHQNFGLRSGITAEIFCYNYLIGWKVKGYLT